MTMAHLVVAMTHLMQFSLVISRCNITCSVSRLSEESIAECSSYLHMCRSFLNLTVKTALKSVDF